MATINIGKGTKIFTHYYKIAGLHDSKIIAYKVKPSNLFAEILSKGKIIVYGDYDILLCLTNNSNSEKQKYSAKSLKKTFCEIVTYELTDTNKIVNIKDIEAVASFFTQPTCFLNIINSSLTNTYIDIKVSGEIRVDLFVSDKISSDSNIRLVGQEENNSKNEIVKENKLHGNEWDVEKYENLNSNIQYWQFEPEDNLTVHDMLEMDLETLKNSARQIELKMPYNITKDDNKKI